VGGESAEDFHKEELSDCEFCENQHGKSHILLRDANQFLSLLSTRQSHITLYGICHFHQNWQMKDQTLRLGIKNNTHTRTMKLRDILKVKNAFVQPVYYVKKYTILLSQPVLLNPGFVILLF